MYYHYGWDFIAFAYLLLIKCLGDGRVAYDLFHIIQRTAIRGLILCIYRDFLKFKAISGFFLRFFRISPSFQSKLMVIFYEITF